MRLDRGWALNAYLDRVLAQLELDGWSGAEARRRWTERGWEELLPVAMNHLSAEAVAADLRRHTCCEICGHPLHQVLGDVAVPVGGALLLVRNLPHTAACSCGYARPLVPEVWTVAATAYLRRHPQAREADAPTVASG